MVGAGGERGWRKVLAWGEGSEGHSHDGCCPQKQQGRKTEWSSTQEKKMDNTL